MTQTAALDPRSRRVASALATGLFVAAWEAMPELVATRRRLVLARTGLTAAAIPVFVAVAPSRALAFGNATDTEHDQHRELAEAASALADPRLALIATGGVILATAGAHLAESRGKKAVVRGLAARGVPRPRTTLGVGFGVLAAVAAYLEETKRP